MNNGVQFIKCGFKSLLKSLKYIFKYKRKYKKLPIHQILVVGGYGYGNTGDEAQCSETLSLLSKRYSQYMIKNLTPNPDYSYSQHGGFHDFASRTFFFNQGNEFNCFDMQDSFLKKVYFFISAVIIYLNAFLVRADLPTIFINAKKAKLLEELKNSSLLFFCGGGFLTGKTLSRLWDGILLCRLCHLFDTPVVMSGQTIGVWDNKFNEKLAKWGFKFVDQITVRDIDFSLEDLAKIGIDEKKAFYTHDDALFCKKSDERLIESDNYITVNFHYWGMDEEQKKVYIEKINKIVKHLTENSDCNLIFIPMIWSDKLSYDDYISKYPCGRFTCFEYDYDFKKVRRVIADSQFCITMKHHPIIFAMGENVPVISLAFSDYYVHKNFGALQQYNQEYSSINFEDSDYFEKFINIFNVIQSDRENVIKDIVSAKTVLAERKEKFLKHTDKILGVE